MFNFIKSLLILFNHCQIRYKVLYYIYYKKHSDNESTYELHEFALDNNIHF